MQKSNNYQKLIQRIGVIGFINIGMLFAVLFINALLTLENTFAVEQIARIAPHLVAPNFLVIGSLFTTIFNVVLNYNILKVLFQLSVDELARHEVLLLFLTSSLVGSEVAYIMQMFKLMDYSMTGLYATIVFVMALFSLTNFFVLYKRKVMEIELRRIIKLNVFFIGYTIVNIGVLLGGLNV